MDIVTYIPLFYYFPLPTSFKLTISTSHHSLAIYAPPHPLLPLTPPLPTHAPTPSTVLSRPHPYHAPTPTTPLSPPHYPLMPPHPLLPPLPLTPPPPHPLLPLIPPHAPTTPPHSLMPHLPQLLLVAIAHIAFVISRALVLALFASCYPAYVIPVLC